MIDLFEVVEIQKELVHNFGGLGGVRDMEALASNLRKPFLKQNGRELFTEPSHRAAVLMEAVLKSKPFVDGNTRMAYLMARLLLLAEGFDLTATEEARRKLMGDVRAGAWDGRMLRLWFARNLTLGQSR